MRPSDKTLHDDLLAAGLQALAVRAAQGEWNDYFGPHPMPQHHLVAELDRFLDGEPLPISSAAPIRAIRDNVITGKYDGTKVESDEWARSPDGRAAFRELARRGK